MTDENTAANQLYCVVTGADGKKVVEIGRDSPPASGRYIQHSVEPDPVAERELSANSKLDDEIRKFEFKRRLEKIQFQVREEFKSEAAELERELERSEPLANALSQPGPCDGDLHSKIMPWRSEI